MAETQVRLPPGCTLFISPTMHISEELLNLIKMDVQPAGHLTETQRAVRAATFLHSLPKHLKKEVQRMAKSYLEADPEGAEQLRTEAIQANRAASSRARRAQDILQKSNRRASKLPVFDLSQIPDGPAPKPEGKEFHLPFARMVMKWKIGTEEARCVWDVSDGQASVHLSLSAEIGSATISGVLLPSEDEDGISPWSFMIEESLREEAPVEFQQDMVGAIMWGYSQFSSQENFVVEQRTSRQARGKRDKKAENRPPRFMVVDRKTVARWVRNKHKTDIKQSAHWRRGHWRYYRHERYNEERRAKPQWIEAVWAGPEDMRDDNGNHYIVRKDL